MTFRDVDSDRLQWLLRNGLAKGELLRFFREQRKPLLMKREKVQNPPSDLSDAIIQFVRFSDSAHEVFADWLRKQDSPDIQGIEGQLVQYFRAIELCKLKLAEGDLHRLARYGLRELYSASPTSEWIDFLHSRIDAKSDGVPKDLTDNPTATANLAAAEAPLSASGLVAVAPMLSPKNDELEYLSLDLVCVPSRNPGPGPYFLEVIGFVESDRVITLSKEDLRVVVPEEGRVILHTTSGLPPPTNGVAETYRVEEFPTALPIKVRAVSFGQRLYAAVYVPHASTNKDAVRDWILNYSKGYRGKHFLFVLADGLCVLPRTGIGITLASSVFDWTFDCWSTLAAVELPQGAHILGPLPPPHSTYECAPVSTVARRFLRNLVARKQLKLTRQQIGDLVALLDDQEVAMTNESKRRISGQLAILTNTDEYYEELIAEILKSAQVQTDIESRKQQAILEVDGELEKKRQLLENLQGATKAQEQRLERLKQHTEARTKEIRASIRKAFDRAKEHEAEVLGQLAFWQELLAPIRKEHPESVETVLSNQTTSNAISIHFCRPNAEPLAEIFSLAGIPRNRCAAYEFAVKVARNLEVPMILAGIGTNYFGNRLGTAIAQKGACIVQIGVGLVDANAFNGVLLDSANDVVVVKSANLSDVTVYASDFLEKVIETVCRLPQPRPGRLFLFSEASGCGALPWPSELETLSLKMHLSEEHEPSTSPDTSKENVLMAPLQRKLWARIEREAELLSAGPEIVTQLRQMMFVAARGTR